MLGNWTSIYNNGRYLLLAILFFAALLLVSNCSYKQRKADRERAELEETINTFLTINGRTQLGNHSKVFRTALDLRSKAVEIADTVAIVRITSYICARYRSIGDYINALKYLNLIPVSSDSTAMNIAYRKVVLFKKLNQLDSALYYNEKALQYGIAENVCDATFGDIYLRMDSLDKAEFYLSKSIRENGLNAKPYLDLAILYDKKGDYNKTEEIYNIVNNISNTGKSNNKGFLVAVIYSYNYARYLVGQGRCSEAEKILSESCKSYNEVSYNKLYQGKTLPFNKYYITSLELLDSLYNCKKNISANLRLSVKDSLLSAKKRYDDYYKNRGIDNSYIFDKIKSEHDKALEDAKYKKRVFIITMVVSVYFFIAFILSIFLYYKKKNKDKNRIIVKEAERKTKSIGSAAHDNSCTIKQKDAEGKYIVLFRQIERLLEEEEIFKNDSLNRKQLAMMLGTNENYVQTAIRLYANGITVSDYINSYRIRYACEYIEENPKAKVIDIACSCGFTNRDTFYKTFERIMQVTFGEYREIKGL